MNRRAIAFLLVAHALASCGDRGAASGNAEGNGGSPPAIRVLFIGNSYTYVNNLPEQVRALAASAVPAQEITVDSVTMGGARLSDLYETSEALARIRAGGWTHVVVQGQSVEAVWPLQDPTGFQDYATRFGLQVNAVGAIPVYYETWARRADNPVYQQVPGFNPARMQAELRDAYRQAAWSVSGLMAPVGDAWELGLAAPAPQELFMSDGSHPSTRGTYLAACILFQILTRRSPIGLGAIPTDISASDARVLQAIAERACLGNACAPNPVLKGSASLSGSHTCAIGDCFYMPGSCSVLLMTDIGFNQDDSAAAASTFRAHCTLRLLDRVQGGSSHTPLIPVRPCSHDLLLHTTSHAGTISVGSSSLVIGGSGATAENATTGWIEGGYTAAFDGTVDAQQAQIAGTASIVLDQVCTLSGALTLQ